MWEYSILMLAVTVLLFVVGILIYRGNTKLIHDYHQTKVKDKKAYGKAFGKALIVLSMAPLVSGIVALFGASNKIAIISVVILTRINRNRFAFPPHFDYNRKNDMWRVFSCYLRINMLT